MNFAWTPDLAIGSAFIDDQHKQLFAAADALFTACQIGKEKPEVEKTMQFLLEYTVKHFTDEEALQEKYQYPLRAEQKRMHNEFTDGVRELSQRLSQHGPTDDFVSEVYIAIGEWLINHIRGEDCKMATYIRE